MKHRHTIALLFLLVPLAGLSREEIPITVPFHKFSQTLLASADFDEKSYIMVPTSKPVGSDELLVGIKRGDAHARDREAFFEIYSYPHAAVGEPLLNYYNGEFVRHSDGSITCFVDVQQGGEVQRVIRLGLRAAHSRDGGRTFSKPRRVGKMDGAEYGYVFESAVRDGRTYMLAMRFTNLAGGRRVDERWPHAGSVDVLVSDNNGETWCLMRDLTAEFGGIPVNESSFVPCGGGWLVACRGYDNRQWLVRTDAEFRQLARRDLTADFDCINSYVGRPRLYEREGRYYLIGRNWTQPLSEPHSPMRLCWFRVSPETLAVERCVVLDNAEGNSVVDGYYATAHWLKRDGIELLNIITHKRADLVSGDRAEGFHDPDLVRLEFAWDEVK